MTIKQTVHKGYIHKCDIITVYKLIYFDRLICLKITTVLIYNCIYIYIHICFQVLKTHI